MSRRATGDLPTRADRARQLGVTVAELACVLGTLVGTGVIGTRVAETSGGELSSDATPLAPAGPAFSIWSVIYLGLAAYTLWQWLPGQATRARQRAVGWLVGASMVLNAAWLLVTQQGWIWASVGVIAALVLVLGVLVARLTALPARSLTDRVLLDGTFGLYLGWVAVAACANVTAALVGSGADPRGTAADLASLGVLLLVAGLGVLLARTLGGRIAVAAAMAWGLAWISVGRLTGEPASTPTALGAAVAAVAVLGAALLVRRAQRR